MEIREATIADWDKLLKFYKMVYRKNHPLLNKDFWLWQYGDKKFGRSFICIDNNEIIGHLGGGFGGGLAWTLNLYINTKYRGRGISEKLHEKLRAYYPLAATSASDKGLKMYKRMGWIRYYNLIRYVKINPLFQNATYDVLCQPIVVSLDNLKISYNHFSRQPTLKCIKLKGKSIAVSQEEVGGLRVTDIKDINALEKHAWELGYKWVDYITSWNGIKIECIVNSGWILDYESGVPWLLNPVAKGCFANVSFLSEKPIDSNLVVHRSYSDHGRIGSI